MLRFTQRILKRKHRSLHNLSLLIYLTIYLTQIRNNLQKNLPNMVIFLYFHMAILIKKYILIKTAVFMAGFVIFKLPKNMNRTIETKISLLPIII